MVYPFQAEPLPDDIYHIPTGLKVSFSGAMDMMGAADLIYIGETHTNIHSHRVQLEIIKELHRRFPGGIAIGMEMFREPQQESLDLWVRGEMTELEFLKASEWYRNWSSDFGYYRDILNFARDNRIDVLALNPSRELQRQLATAAGGEVPPELAGRIPESGPEDPYQRQIIEAIFGGHASGPGMLDSFLDIQLLWEETMASRIAEYLDSPSGKGRKMVVLTGGLHVQYGFGVPKKVLRRRPAPYAIVLTEAISIPEEKREALTMDVDVPFIPLLAGDFLWMVPYEDLEDDKVLLGVMMAPREGKVFVEKVLEGSVAEKGGIEAGDELVSLDGLPVEEAGDVILAVKSKKAGDDIAVVVRRGEQVLSLTPRFPEETELQEEGEDLHP